MDDQLQQLIELQKEQNQLLKRHLWRVRFSLMSLLLLTTVTAIGLGILVYQNQSKLIPGTPSAPPTFSRSWTPSQETLTVGPILNSDELADELGLFENAQGDNIAAP